MGAKGLSALIHKEEAQGRLHGCRIVRGAYALVTYSLLTIVYYSLKSMVQNRLRFETFYGYMRWLQGIRQQVFFLSLE